jgi:2-polyprenyl-3-methyl-5-hydroxy-6-metoxy-1,4-benzoquinol methylase
MTESRYIHGTRKSEHRRLAALNALTNPSFLEFLRLDKARSVLEVGSGMGILTREVARSNPQAEVVGVEYSPAQLEKAKNHGRPNLRFVQGDGHGLKFEDGRFEVVYCRWVLEHVADPVQVLREMRRVLKPRGRIFVEENDVGLQRYDPPVPRAKKMWSLIVQLQKMLGGDALIGSKLFGLLAAAGFKKINLSLGPEVYASGTPGFRTWIKNQIGIFRGCAEDLLKHRLATPGDTEGAVTELREFLDRPHAATWFAWNRASSRK